MNEIKMKYSKINVLDWCKCCDQGWVRIIKDTDTGKLYCECDELFSLWESPEDYENNVYIKDNRLIKSALATEEKIISHGWNKPINKITTCSVCFFNTRPNSVPAPILRDHGWVVIKKDTDSGKLFCRCETCGSIWEDIRDVLRKGIPPSTNTIDNFADATRDEIVAAGWDYYDDIFHIID